METAKVGRGELTHCGEAGFSTEEDFISHGPEPADGNAALAALILLVVLKWREGSVGAPRAMASLRVPAATSRRGRLRP